MLKRSHMNLFIGAALSIATLSASAATLKEKELYIHPKIVHSPWDLVNAPKVGPQAINWMRKTYASHSAFKVYDSEKDAKQVMEEVKDGVLVNTTSHGTVYLLPTGVKEEDKEWYVTYKFDRTRYTDSVKNDVDKVAGNKFAATVTLAKQNIYYFEQAVKRTGYTDIDYDVTGTANSAITDFNCKSVERELHCKAVVE